MSESENRYLDDECYLLPSSFGQERLWLLDRIGAGQAYHMTGALRLDGDLDIGALDRATAALADRHEILRTTFELGVDGELCQVIHPRMTMSAHLCDPCAGERAATRIVAGLLAEPFDLAVGPLLRTVLVPLTDEPVWLLGIAMHHIVSDGWSISVLLAELTALYRAETGVAPAVLPELPIQYGDFAAWQRDRFATDDEDQLDYWRTALSGARPVETISGDVAVTDPTAGGSVPITVSPDTAGAVRTLAREESATPYMVAAAAYAAVLARWAEAPDITIGIPVAGRDRAELAGLIGFFVNTLPLRLTIDRSAGFRELLRHTRRTFLDAYAHQEVPFERIVEVSGADRMAGRAPLLGAFIAMQHVPPPVNWAPGIRVTAVELPVDSAQFPLSLDLRERDDGGMTGLFVHALRDWSRAEATVLAQAWQTLLDGGARSPDRPIGTLPLNRGAATAQAIDAGGPAATGRADRMIERAASAHPDRVAITAGADELTYAQLCARARHWAARLRAAGAGPERLVVILLPRSAAQLVAVLAVWQAGAAYVPLDPSLPRARVARLLDEAAPTAIITDERTAATMDADGDDGAAPPILVIDGPRRDTPPRSAPSGRADVPDSGAALAYAIYTSGSTGTPKAAMNSHDAIVNYVGWLQRRTPLAPGDAVLYKTPLSFDAAVWEWLWPLTVGGRVVVADPEGHRDPGYTARIIVAESVAVCQFVPPMLHAFLADPAAGRCDGVLRTVICGGEVLSPHLARRFFDVLPDTRLYNQYGPAEAAVDVTWHQVGTDDLSRYRVPIGRPLPGVRLRVLDRSGDPVPRGMPGELHIAGIALGRGYLGRTALTAEMFTPDPLAADGSRMYRTGDRVRQLPDGSLDYLGRYDQQIKVRGVRVEPGEIEAALGEHPDVQHSAVIAGGEGADRRLIAYFVSPDRTPEPPELRSFLLGRLPRTLVPEAFVALPSLPVTASEKLDVAALPPAPSGRPTGERLVPPRTAVEQVLARMWADVLRVPEVGVTDNFYDLGGNSLRAVAVFQRAEEAGLLLPLDLMLGDHTIEQLAVRLSEGPDEALKGIGQLLT